MTKIIKSISLSCIANKGVKNSTILYSTYSIFKQALGKILCKGLRNIHATYDVVNIRNWEPI